MFNTFLSRAIVKVLASQTKKENHLRLTFCPKDLLTRFGNSIPTLLHIVIGVTGIMAVKQIKVCTMYSFFFFEIMYYVLVDMGFATRHCVFMKCVSNTRLQTYAFYAMMPGGFCNLP